MEEPDTYRRKNLYLLKPENVERRNGEVFTGNLMQISSLRRSEQFKNALFSDNMSAMDVRVRLEEAFPELSNTRFSCAKRESRDSAKLNFDGDRRVWDGITIKRKLPGSSALYIVVEDEGTDSGVSSAAEYISQPSPLETLRNIFIEPDWGPVQGGTPVKLNNIQVDSSVQILQAFFGRRQAGLVRAPEGNSWLGVTPGGDFEGQTVRVVVGNGTTKFTYMDRTEKAFEDILNNPEIWSDFFNKLDQNQNSSDLGTDVLGLPQEGRQLQSVQILCRLLFTAARIGEEKFIRLVFGTSAGRAAFEAYKNKPPLPENIADENGHEEIATYLRSITERFSEENDTSQTQSKDVGWKELLKAIEDGKVQSSCKRAKTKEVEEDNILETVYFGDTEESSDSDQERTKDEHIQRPQNELQPKHNAKKSKQKLNRSQLEVAAALTPEDDFLTGTEQAAREHRVEGRLRNANKQLHEYVTSPLQVKEVKQDQLRTDIKLDVLTKLSRRLQELYSQALGMLAEAVKCSEDLRKDFYDLTYHGLRAEHYELVYRVKDLESAQEEMSEEEKKKYDRLQSYQRGRQSQVERLDRLWKSFFSQSDHPLSKTGKRPMSLEIFRMESKEVKRRTDPEAMRNKVKSRGEETESATPSTSNDDKPGEVSRCNLVTKKPAKRSLIRPIFRKKDGGEKKGSNALRTPLRDC